jgi:hypothetical protein
MEMLSKIVKVIQDKTFLLVTKNRIVCKIYRIIMTKSLKRHQLPQVLIILATLTVAKGLVAVFTGERSDSKSSLYGHCWLFKISRFMKMMLFFYHNSNNNPSKQNKIQI